MRLHTKALYNLLRYKYLEDPSIDCEKWQIEDLKLQDIDDLLSRLGALGISLDKRHFVLYAEDCDCPEKLTDCLIVDKKSEILYDQIYLIIFELWRRLIPEKPSMSIFCDELDYRIFLYNKGNLETEELIEDAVANLLDVLDENIDQGKDPKGLFVSLSRYCAHDLESFLYDYIADNIDEDNDSYANDLIENFYQFLSKLSWFDFLRVRITAKTDIKIANEIIKKIIDDEKEKPEIDLSLEILAFMVREGDPELFIRLAKLIFKNVKIEKDLIELFSTMAEFYRRLDQADKEKNISQIINERKGIDPRSKIECDKKLCEKIELILNKPVEV